MNRKNLALFLLLTTSILLAFAAQPRTKAAALIRTERFAPP